MKKAALFFLLAFMLGVWVTSSYSEKLGHIPDLIGTYEGSYTRFDLVNKKVRDPEELTMYISGQDGRHFWGSIYVPSASTPCNYFNGVILDDNTMYYTQFNQPPPPSPLIPNNSITTGRYHPGLKQIETVTVRPLNNETSYGLLTFSSKDVTGSVCPY